MELLMLNYLLDRTFDAERIGFVFDHPHSVIHASLNGFPNDIRHDAEILFHSRLRRYCEEKGICLSILLSGYDLFIRIEGRLLPVEESRNRPGESGYIITAWTIKSGEWEKEHLDILRNAILKLRVLGEIESEKRDLSVRSQKFIDRFSLPHGIHVDGLRQSRYNCLRFFGSSGEEPDEADLSEIDCLLIPTD